MSKMTICYTIDDGGKGPDKPCSLMEELEQIKKERDKLANIPSVCFICPASKLCNVKMVNIEHQAYPSEITDGCIKAKLAWAKEE